MVEAGRHAHEHPALRLDRDVERREVELAALVAKQGLRVLDISTRERGESHIETLILRNNFAYCLGLQERLDEATLEQADIAAKASAALGAEHFQTALFLGNSGGFQDWNIDLSAYKGKQVEVSITYAQDFATAGLGVFVDAVQILKDGAVAETQGFENGLAPWVAGPQPADKPLRAPVAVYVGGVEERHAGVGCGAQRRQRLVLVDFAPVGPDLPGAEADRGDLATEPPNLVSVHSW